MSDYRKQRQKLLDQLQAGTFKTDTEKRLAQRDENLRKQQAEAKQLATKSDEDLAPVKRTWFKKGAFEDGYDFGDITKTILGTTTDLTQDLGAGILGIGEKTIDTGAYLLGGGAKLLGAKTFSDDMEKFIKKDLIDEEKISTRIANYSPTGVINNILTGNLAPYKPTNIFDEEKTSTGSFEENSLLGEKSDSLVQSAGQLAGTFGLQFVGVPWWLTTGVTSFGGEAEQAFKKDATYGEAGASALISAGAEILTEKISGGISFGGKTLDVGAKELVSNIIANKTVQNLTKFGMDMVGEGFEEVLTEVINNVGKKLTYEDEETWKEILASEEAMDAYLESFIGGAVLGGVMNTNRVVDSVKNGKDYDTGLPLEQAEQQVQELEQLKVEKEAELKQAQDVREQQIIQEEIQVIDEELSSMQQDLKQRNFTYEANETDSNYKKAVYESAKQVNMNDTEVSHKLADAVAKISEERQTTYLFVDNQALEAMGHKIEGKTINGLVDENGAVLLNIESEKLVNRVLGHETTHLLEGTKEYDELKTIAIEFAKTTGDYQSRLDSLNSLYEGRNADIEAELTADIVGDYLFSSEQFVKELSVQKPTIFQKIKELISDLVVKFKGTAQEKQLRELQRKFENAYRNTDSKVSETSKNVIDVDNQGRQLTDEQRSYFKDSKVRDKNGNLQTVYHGTRGDFNTFETKRTGQNYEGDYSSLGRGSYFTANKETAKDFGESSTNEGDLNIKETYIDIKNPFYADEMSRNDSKVLKEISEKYDIKEDDLYDGYNLVRLLNSKGVDSTEVLQEYGYDGIIAEDEFVVFDSNQVKNVDNVKPTESKDIRYSLTDKQGRKLSEQQQEYFKDSKVRDENGKLLVMYHGTPKGEFTVFDNSQNKRLNSYYKNDEQVHFFTTKKGFAKLYSGEDGATYKTYLNITNPYVAEIENKDFYIPEVERRFINEAKENGYDGVRFIDKSGKESDIWVAFYPEQIKNVDNKKPTTNPDIRYSLSETDSEGNKVSEAMRRYMKNTKVVDENGNLKRVYHGTTGGEFTIFDKSKGSIEGDFGSGFYFTDNASDVETNYEGGGADFENKVSRLAEQIQDNENISYEEAEQKAREELYVDSYKFTTYLKMENPAYVDSTWLFDESEISDDLQTRLDEEAEYRQDEIEERARENYDLTEEDTIEDYMLEEARNEIFEENGIDIEIRESLWEDTIEDIIDTVSIDFDGQYRDLEQLRSILWEAVADGGKRVNDLKMQIEELYLYDSNGSLATNEITRMVIEKLGYDGIIDTTVSEKFKGMNLAPDTTHYIVFNPNQIKNVTNENPTENPDINLSLSKKGEQNIAPTGDFDISSEDIKLQIQEAIAPMQELVTDLVEQMKTIAPVQDAKIEENAPYETQDAPVPVKTEINEKGVQMGIGDQVRTFNNSTYEVTDFFKTDDGVVRARLRDNKGYETSIGINSIAENLSDPTKNNVSTRIENDSLQNSEIAEIQNTEAFDNITEDNIPSKIEDTTPDIEENIENMPVESPLQDRNIEDVGNRKVKAYQYENPEVRPYFQAEARNMLYDLENTVKGEKIAIKDEAGYITDWAGVSRQTTEAIAYLKDTWGYSYAQIEKGLNDIIKDEGSENNAVAKRIEFLLDERLREGYTASDGIQMPPNEDYIKFLEEKQITEYNSQNIDSLAVDENVPVEETIEAPVKTNENAQISNETQEVIEDVAPVENVPENSNTEPKTLRVKEVLEKLKQDEAKERKLVDSVEKAKQEEFDKIAEVLTERPTAENKKQRLIMKARASFIDKGSVFEDLSLKTKNRELMAKWDNLMLANAKAQHVIGKGVQVSNADTKMIEQKTKSLDSIRETVVNSGKLQEFSEYMYHMLNIDRMTLDVRMEEDNKPVFGDNVTAEQSKQMVRQLQFDNPEFMDWANDIYDYNKALRDVLVENGVISQKDADYYEKKYPHYVPIQRVDVNGNAINVPLDTNRTGINTPIRKATGGNSDIMPLFDTLASRTFQTYRASSKNSFGVELRKAMKSANKVEQTSVESIMDSVEDQESLLQEGKNGQAPTFTVFEDGKKVTYEITQDMFDALKPISDSSFLSTTIKPLNMASNFHRGVLTQYNPLFALTNSMKDIQDVLINSQHPAKTYAKFGEAYAQLLNKGYWYQEYMANGGEQNSYFDSQDGFDKTPKGVEKITEFLPIKAIGKLNDFMETAPRLAEYIASREAGRSVEVSMLDASRVTTNFKAGGDVTKWANRNGFTFLNASIQGLNQNIRNVREAHSQGLKGYLNLATKFTIAGVPALLLNALLWDDDEEYEELSDYVKQNYYVIGKTEDGTFIRIPKGRMSAVLQEGANQMANLITGNDEADLSTFLELALNNLAPNNPVENNIFSPIVQAYSNKTWYGEDLVPTRLQDEPVEQQYDESTDKFSIWLGQTLGVSPYKINYLLDQYSGGIGDVLLPMGTAQAEGRTEDNIASNLIAPFVNKFTTNSTLNNKNVSDFYSTSEELTSNANSVEATDEDVLKNKYINSVKSEMNKLYKEKRDIQSDETLSDTDKYDKVLEVQEKINALSKEGLNTYENVGKTSTYAQIGDREYYKKTNKDGEEEWYKVEKDELAEINDLGMDINDKTTYFNLKTKITQIKNSEAEDKKSQIATLVRDTDLTDEQKAYIYGKHYSSDKKLDMITSSNIPFNEYLNYASQTFVADKDSDGDSISGSRRNKIIDYVNSLDLTIPQKAMLIRTEYSTFTEYNNEIVDYVIGLNVDYEEKVKILESLDMTIDEDGYVYWD